MSVTDIIKPVGFPFQNWSNDYAPTISKRGTQIQIEEIWCHESLLLIQIDLIYILDRIEECHVTF